MKNWGCVICLVCAVFVASIEHGTCANTLTGEIDYAAVFGTPGESAIVTNLFTITLDAGLWTMRIDGEEGYSELKGRDGKKTCTVICSSDAELKKALGSKVDTALYPATIDPAPCPAQGTSAGRVVWLALGSSGTFSGNKKPYIPALWSNPFMDPAACAIGVSRHELLEGATALPSLVEFVVSTNALMAARREAAYLSRNVSEDLVHKTMAAIREYEGCRIAAYRVTAKTNFEGHVFPLEFELEVFDPVTTRTMQAYHGRVRTVATHGAKEFLPDLGQLKRGVFVQDRRFSDRSRRIEMIRYPLTDGVWLERNDAYLVSLFKSQRAVITPFEEGNLVKVRMVFLILVAVTLVPLALFVWKRQNRQS